MKIIILSQDVLNSYMYHNYPTYKDCSICTINLKLSSQSFLGVIQLTCMEPKVLNFALFLLNWWKKIRFIWEFKWGTDKCKMDHPEIRLLFNSTFNFASLMLTESNSILWLHSHCQSSISMYYLHIKPSDLCLG